MLRNSLTLGRIAGIEVGVHYTWLFIAGLVAWSLAQGYFPSLFPGWPLATYWIAGIVAAFVLFASVLVHELAHSLVSISRGVPVRSITLFIFGGVSQMKEEAQRPFDDFLVAAAGPATSIVLAGIFWLSTGLTAPASPPAAVLGYLGFVNLLLALFNLIPGFPLDGGRVLRAIIWGITGSLRRGTQIASYIGQGFGLLFVLVGVWQLLGGAALNGLWIAVIGLFLNGAAGTARQSQETREALRGIHVADVMNPDPGMVDPDTSVEAFVYHYVLRLGQRALPVVHDGRLMGLVSITDVKKVPQPAWASTAVADIMSPAPLKMVSSHTGLETALRLIVEGEYNQLPVVDDHRLVGMVSRADILRYLQMREAIHEMERTSDEASRRRTAA